MEELLANPEDPSNRMYSIEFCGGTHLRDTGEARAFALLSEEGIAKVGQPLHQVLPHVGLVVALILVLYDNLVLEKLLLRREHLTASYVVSLQHAGNFCSCCAGYVDLLMLTGVMLVGRASGE